MNKCKKCLLLEAGEKAAYEEIKRYVDTLDKNELVKETVFEERLKKCKSCDNLISGMCLKCGCYVEVRARLMDTECPDENSKRW